LKAISSVSKTTN